MESLNTVIKYVSAIVGFIVFVQMFYLSILKCFRKDGRGKIRLFFLCFFTGPLFVNAFSQFIAGIIYLFVQINNASFWESSIATQTLMMNESVGYYVLSGLIFFLNSFIASWILSRKLKAKYPSLVVFVYLMSDVLLLLSMRTIDGSLFGNSELAVLLFSLADFLISMLSYGLFYFLVIRGLSSLTDRELATERRVFILPPALFVLLYATVCFSLFYYLDGAAVLCLSGSTILIEFLFIWAFYIIIRNINATGDALEAKEEVKALSVEVMEALAHTIDAKDEYTKGHSVRVAAYSRMLAERMGLSADECENVYYMGLLHDIGKIGVPNEIINSPTKLTEEEFSVVKMHPGLGFDILSEIKSRPDLAIGARWHHERFDGSGYPDGRAGEEIPLPARIISVADSYDAMTSNRSYRKYLSQEKVKEELKKNEGTQFDPGVVSAMLKIMEEDSEYSLHE